ncbi:methyltransferase domain-containing protein [Armatimonas sp.]|uniref:methyltransferase domain-containing protein n=1 Tax=Armatimonas sp. TaxID=1872638 RepID=UPI003753C272
MTIREELLSLLICPETGAALSGWDGVSEQGTLTTDDGRSYPVTDGIANLLPDALRGGPADDTEVAEKRSEMQARDAQVKSYDQMLGLKLFTYYEVPLTLKFLPLESSHLMLEGGCGTGRMTRTFAERTRGLLCVDFSRESLRVAKTKVPPELADRVLFVQADLSRLPTRSDAFDRVGSFGVYEHIPTPEARDGALKHLARACKSAKEGGRLALSAYRWGPPISWSSQREGHHPGGIYFIRLTQNELKAQCSPHFSVHGATEALLYYHLIWGQKDNHG